MKLRRPSAPMIAGLAVLLAACAAAPVYRPSAAPGEAGYSQTRLGEARYRVTFSGDEHTSPAVVRDYALLRAADLTIENGADWFSVSRQDTRRREAVGYDAGPGFVTPPTRTVYRQCGLLSCSTAVAYTPGYADGGPMETTVRTAYSSLLEIELHKGRKPADDVNAYDARDVAASLRTGAPGH